MTLIVEANGAKIPAVGLGTWQLSGKTGTRAIAKALEVGYRHLDTAAMYENERDVGEALRASGVPREEVFVTTKVWTDSIGHGPLQRSAEASLKRLKLDHVDLLLIHWPNPAIPLADSIRALCEVKERGLARHIGVSNFTVTLLDKAVKLSSEPLVTNQVEYHPFLDQSKVLAGCRRHGMSVTAYCPLARGRVFASKVMAEIATAKGRTVSQIATRWLIQQPGVIAIPRTEKLDRIEENFQVFDFTLSEEEMDRISGLADRSARVVDFDFSPAWD